MVLTCILSMHAGGEQPIPLWNEHDTSTDADKPKILLYSLSLMFKVSHVHVSFSMKSQTNTSDSLGKATRWRLSSNFVLFYVIFSERSFSCSQGIQMTATTPSMRAVRFETGLIELELSNRIQCKAQPGGSSSYLKLFGKCQVDLNLALGQIVKHQVQISLLQVKYKLPVFFQ